MPQLNRLKNLNKRVVQTISYFLSPLDKRYTSQSSDPVHPGKKRSITTTTSLKHKRLQEIINFFTGCMVLYLKYVYILTQMHFSKVISQHTVMEGSCTGTDIPITPANFNHQNCKSRCIYQVLKFPNQSPICYSGVHSFLRPSSA